MFHLFHFHFLIRSKGNKAYFLDVGAKKTPVYCHMTYLNGCGGGGRTLVMKIDGEKVRIPLHQSQSENFGYKKRSPDLVKTKTKTKTKQNKTKKHHVYVLRTRDF